MSGLTKVTDSLDELVTVLKRAIEAAFSAAVLIGLACLTVLVVAGTFAVLHDGDDFEFGERGGLGGGGGGGDVIVMWGSLR
jgi:hypothetical protein